MVLGDSKAAQFTYSDPEGNQRLRCVTSEYAFTLERPGPDSEYLVRYYGNSPSRLERERAVIAWDLDPFALAATQVFDLPLIDFFERPSFRLLEFEHTELDGAEYVRIAFELDDPVWTVKRGEVYLSEEYDWAVARYVMHAVNSAKIRLIYSGNSTFRRLPEGDAVVPKTSMHEVRILRPGEAPIIDLYKAEVVDVQLGAARPSDFTLPGYGLPDIPLNPVRSRPISWFIVANAILALVLLLWFVGRRLLRRRDAHPKG